MQFSVYPHAITQYIPTHPGIGDEGRLRELCNELLGPTYAAATTSTTGTTTTTGGSTWQPTVLGLDKRTLLQQRVLPVVGKRRDMQRVALEFSELLEHVQQQAGGDAVMGDAGMGDAMQET